MRDIIRGRAARTLGEQFVVLEAIAAGTMTYCVDSPKGRTTYQPTARDRLAAIEILGRYAGMLNEDVGAGNDQNWRTSEALSRSLLAALSDPSVRRWLVAERPEVLGALVGGIADRISPPAVEASAEIVLEPSPDTGSRSEPS